MAAQDHVQMDLDYLQEYLHNLSGQTFKAMTTVLSSFSSMMSPAKHYLVIPALLLLTT